jgi:hypothetical protein
LYAPNYQSPFACRKCWRLLYWSQFIKWDHPLGLFYRDASGRARPLSMTRSAERQREKRSLRKIERLVRLGDVQALSALTGGLFSAEAVAQMLPEMLAEMDQGGAPKAR